MDYIFGKAFAQQSNIKCSCDTISDDDDPDFNVDDEYESVEDDGSDEQHIPNSSDVDTDVEGEFDSLVVRNVTNLPVGGVPSG
ncbi:hypothetical protein RJT34_32087 [Clitoria ternatea]|uniref:Uncharacterized protein n=1 Tax=Clitoria ternatea TaxID=43366 RepID=A0AAN9EX22_CLITE